MTNTLHRFGDAQSFRDDYIVFAIASRGKNDENSVPKLRRFLEIAMQFKPVNLGDSRHGGAYRPSRSMSPLAHWNRDNEPDFQKVIEGFDTTARPPRCSTTSKRPSSARRRFAKPISASASTSRRRSTAPSRAATPRAFTRHSAGYSLGFEGKTEHLPNGDVLALSTMCGHGMVSMSLAKKMIDWVKEGRRTPDAGVSRAEPVLLVRGVQSVARDAAAGRGAGADEVRRAARGFFFALAIGAVACGGGAPQEQPAPAASAPAADVLVLSNFTLIDGNGGRAGRELRADCDGRPHHLDRPRVRARKRRPARPCRISRASS